MRQSAALQISVAAAVLCAAISACGSSSQVDASRIQAQYDGKTGRLTRLEYDANSNGKADTWAFMDGTRISRLEADENEDGKIDRWEHYHVGLQSQGTKPVPERIERATRLDGRVSRREFFEQGRLARIEEDTNGDGALDKWETYAAGVLAVLTLDMQHRGKPDRKFFYRPDGSLDRIEVDAAGTGQFQPVKQQ
jgi:hypothetical protein